jgi:hypothetical protein
LTGNEPGADEVQAHLTEAIAGRAELYASFVTLTEVEYITVQEEGAVVAQQRLADLTALPIQWFHSDATATAAVFPLELCGLFAVQSPAMKRILAFLATVLPSCVSALAAESASSRIAFI